MANAAALPPLPSVRAKDLENRASALSKRHASKEGDGRKKDADDDNSEQKNNDQTKTDSKQPNELLSNNNNSNRDHDVRDALEEQQYHDVRLKQIETLHQKEQKVFDQMPPLDPAVSCDAIHQYLSTTSQFLNSYLANANSALDGTSHKLSVLEKQMSLLESKLASIPGLFPDDVEECNVETINNEETER